MKKSFPRFKRNNMDWGLRKISGKHSDPLDGVDLREEYSLIQLKKSKLSASNRDLVVRRYRTLIANAQEQGEKKV